MWTLSNTKTHYAGNNRPTPTPCTLHGHLLDYFRGIGNFILAQKCPEFKRSYNLTTRPITLIAFRYNQYIQMGSFKRTVLRFNEVIYCL